MRNLVFKLVNPDLSQVIHSRLNQATALLCDLVSIRSISGYERKVAARLAEALSSIGLPSQWEPMPPMPPNDPDLPSSPPTDSDERGNLYSGFPTRNQSISNHGRSIILQTHLDVVPAGEWGEAFTPIHRDGRIYGRGACDCKGQAVVIWLAMAALRDLAIELNGRVDIQFVGEEEIGGIGALAAILNRPRADGVIVLEPTSMNIHPACRGALWFRLKITGKSTHMGRKYEGINAIDKAVIAIAKLYKYEKQLLEESVKQPLFSNYPMPVQVNIGQLNAGEWPSMVAGKATLEGGVGFLPDRDIKTVEQELNSLFSTSDDNWLSDHFELDFPGLRNEAFSTPLDHPLVTTLVASAHSTGIAPVVRGWNASCDARLYARRGNMPTVVFGEGDMGAAHSSNEFINDEAIALAATFIANTIMQWCNYSS